MKITTDKNLDAKDVVKRMLYLAYKESHIIGAGHLQERSDATEDEVFDNVVRHGDYPFPIPKKENEFNAEYVFGRCMKTRFNIINNNEITCHPEKPKKEFQTWAYKIKSYEDLYNSAIKSLV